MDDMQKLREWYANGVRDDAEKKREFLGRVVRRAWLLWAMKQPNPRPSWLLSFDELSEPDREVDRQIGAAVEHALTVWAKPAHGMGIEKKEEELSRLSETPSPPASEGTP